MWPRERFVGPGEIRAPLSSPIYARNRGANTRRKCMAGQQHLRGGGEEGHNMHARGMVHAHATFAACTRDSSKQASKQQQASKQASSKQQQQAASTSSNRWLACCCKQHTHTAARAHSSTHARMHWHARGTRHSALGTRHARTNTRTHGRTHARTHERTRQRKKRIAKLIS